MINFEQKLRANGKSHQFNFYGLTISTGRIFLIVCHSEDEDTVFRMKENGNGKWAGMTDGPAWLSKIENELSAIIEKRLAESL